MSERDDSMFQVNLEKARMAENARIKGLDAEFAMRTHKERLLVEVLNEACKASIVINGGAAVAMGALLQALWDKGGASPAKVALLWGIACCAVGVGLAAGTFVLRYFAMAKPVVKEWGAVDNAWGAWALATGLASLAAFVLGSLVAVFGLM